MGRPPDWDNRFDDLLKMLRGRRNHGEMLFIVNCLRRAADEDIFHFLILGTHWFYQVRDDLVCASGSSRRRVEGTGTEMYLDLARKVGVPPGAVHVFYSPYYSQGEKVAFAQELARISNPTAPAPVAPPTRPEEKKEPWHYLE